ncbi:MAG: SUMF1/EgtB/PvdO family nonheme iron enzyme [Chlamydiales bacterium]
MDKKTLGDYNIIKQIGQGPLGAVLLGEHRFIKKRFALKVLPEELSNDRNFIQRFEKWIASLATLEHPHIVKVHNISFADGYYFLVTDCIVDQVGETTNLAHFLSVNERRLPEQQVMRILRQVAGALDYAHGKQLDGKALAHRGIKLNNILIGKNAEDVFLSDFGLSAIIGEGVLLTKMYKALANSLSVEIGPERPGMKSDKYVSDSNDSAKLTKLHLSFLQNYSFLAPEQKIAHKQDTVDMKADIWSFGVLAYYLLMRTFPEGRFPMPSTFLRDFTCKWDDLVCACLNPDPLARPTGLCDLLDSIERVNEEQEPIKPKATPYTPPYSGGGGGTATVEKAQQETKTVVESIPSFFKVTSPKVQTEPKPQPVIKPQAIDRPTYDPDPGKIFQSDSHVAPYRPEQTAVQEVEPLLNDMVVVEGGEYYRGSNEGGRDERPLHSIRLRSFALDIHPVSNEQFVRFLETMGGEKDCNNNDIVRLRESRIKRSAGRLIIESGYSRHPVVGVSWYGAMAYAKWIGKRLPTEAEWEIASHGGLPEAIYPTGSHIDRTQANFFSADTTAVGSYPPNNYGLYDMAGNVYEWCQDWYDRYDESMEENPNGPTTGVYRVLRGGCWKSLKDDLRCALRHRNNPGTVNKTYGFRCAADVAS